MSEAQANTLWARVFVDELVRAGVREACVAPGSRSTPLVLALARHEEVEAFVHFDERSASFFALGLARCTGRPAAVVTTSGTATANLFPAVVEAGASGTPLLLLTADRPRRLRGTDANQTTDQAGLYGGHVRLFHDVARPDPAPRSLRYLRALAARAVAASAGSPAGPVHLNFPFDKPLEPPPAGGGSEGRRASREEEDGGRSGGRPWTRVGATVRVADPEEVSELVHRLSE
ncbi:MAG: 2-succinyl-5-enolpyruvyl-6-hydroxy-3-cyclohexene-1-carboxylic-acid synthase, partial [Gemmatimonadota bacterium]